MSDDDGDSVPPRRKSQRGGPPTKHGSGAGADDHKVGYKKPPIHSRFKRGQPSANPRGRPKGSSRVDPITRILSRKVKITEHGQVKLVSLSEAVTRVAIKKALDGDVRYHAILFKAQRELAKIEAARAPTSEELLAEAKENEGRDERQRELARMLVDYLTQKASEKRIGGDLFCPDGTLQVGGWYRLEAIKPLHRPNFSANAELRKLMSDIDDFVAEDPKYGLPSKVKIEWP